VSAEYELPFSMTEEITKRQNRTAVAVADFAAVETAVRVAAG